MRKAPFLIATTLFFALSAPSKASVVINQGKAEVHVQATTKGNGTVSTHIETDVNGDKQAYDSSKSGTVTIDATNNPTPIATVSAAEAGPSAQPIIEHQEKKALLQVLFDDVKNFFKNFFRLF